MDSERRTELLEQVAANLTGTCNGIIIGVNQTEMTDAERAEAEQWDEDDLLDVNLETCSECGWWELDCSPNEDDNEKPLCDQCWREWQRSLEEE